MAHRLAFLTAAILTLTAASGARSTVATVAAGTDYLQTTSGTYFDFGPQVVPLEGYPIGPFNTDTIVERTSDVTTGGSAGSLLVTGLSLESTVPVMGATIYVTLDPTKLADDTGTITIGGGRAAARSVPHSTCSLTSVWRREREASAVPAALCRSRPAASL
jgi:hypothetical protein